MFSVTEKEREKEKRRTQRSDSLATKQQSVYQMNYSPGEIRLDSGQIATETNYIPNESPSSSL